MFTPPPHSAKKIKEERKTLSRAPLSNQVNRHNVYSSLVSLVYTLNTGKLLSLARFHSESFSVGWRSSQSEQPTHNTSYTSKVRFSNAIVKYYFSVLFHHKKIHNSIKFNI